VDELDFHGQVATGVGNHSKLGIPGRGQIPAAPNDWPATLHGGSLNIKLFTHRMPAAFKAHGLLPSVRSLDSELFRPEFVIPQDRIARNTIGRERGPKGGDAQVWRAAIFFDGKHLTTPPCWVLRRFGSEVGEQLELVSGERLRDVPAIAKDWSVVMVRMFGQWSI
jgi:hypothetical protein